MSAEKVATRLVLSLCALVIAAALLTAQARSPARLLVLLKGGPPEATWAGGGALAIIDPVTAKVIGRVPTGENAHEITVSDDGKLAFLTAGGGVSIIDVATNKLVRTLLVQTKRSNRLKFTPHGQRVLISDFQGGELVVVDAMAGKVIRPDEPRLLPSTFPSRRHGMGGGEVIG